MESDTIRHLLGLAVVFGLLGLLVWHNRRAAANSGIFSPRSWVARFSAAPSRQPPVRQVARLRLSPQHSLHLVEVHGRSLLLGCSPSGITLVGPRDQGGFPIEVEPRRSS